MSNTIPYFLLDTEKVKLTKDDLFDRIVNIRLTTDSDTFVIRSDWEVYKPDYIKSVTYGTSLTSNSKYYVRKCYMKPSIKVQYKRVSADTGIELDIFISNFYLMDKSGQIIHNFNNMDNPLTKVEIVMGYFGQFKVFEPSSAEEMLTLGFVNDTTSEMALAKNGLMQITASVQYATVDKLPPDMTLHIHGYVGGFTKKPVGSPSFEGTYEGITNLSNKLSNSSSSNFLEDIYFENITRKYLVDVTKESSITVETKTGKMSASDAKLYGYQVILSDYVANLSSFVKEKYTKKDAEGKSVTTSADSVFSFSSAMTLQQAFNALHKELALDLNFTALDEKTYFIYSKNESATTLHNAVALVKHQKSTALNVAWKNRIPAVYNISTDALCTIVSPFFYFIEPFSLVKFKSRYALSGLVSYWSNYNTVEENFFTLWQVVSFATVEDVNENQLICTGSK